MSIQELIKKLQDVENVVKDMGFDVYDVLPEQYYAEASFLAEELLINPNGGCNWANIRALRYEGFDVFPLEKDSFGWLIGGIQTMYGVVPYG